MTAVPLQASDLTPAWLSEVLGVAVSGVVVLEKASATNQRVRIRIEYENEGAGPPSLFVKLASLDAEHRQMIGASAMGEREARFYADVAPSVDLRVPKSYLGANAEDGSFVLVLEDLAAAGCAFSGGDWGVTADAAAGALEELARFHAHFEDPVVRAAKSPWAAQSSVGHSDMVAGLLSMILEQQHNTLSEAYLATGQLYVEHHARIDQLWDSGPATYIHGDCHIGNVFLDGGRVGFLDWGLSRVSTHMRDVSYFLTMTVDPDERRRSQRDLLGLYLDALRANGGADIDFDRAWLAHRVQASYTVLATFLVFMPSYLASDAQKLGADLLRRAQLALDDLEVVDALQAVLK